MTRPSGEAKDTVGGVMHSGVVTCRPDATLRMVAGLLAEHRVHAIVVTGPEGSSGMRRRDRSRRRLRLLAGRARPDHCTRRGVGAQQSQSDPTSTCETRRRRWLATASRTSSSQLRATQRRSGSSRASTSLRQSARRRAAGARSDEAFATAQDVVGCEAVTARREFVAAPASALRPDRGTRGTVAELLKLLGDLSQAH